MEVASFLFVVTAGSLAHFGFNFFGCHTVSAAFFPVNESVWEHLKLIFFPLFFFALFEWIMIGKERHNFWAAKTLSVVASMVFIVSSFYLYTHLLGRNFFIADIIIFILAAALGSLVSGKVLLRFKVHHGALVPSLLIIGLIGSAFVFFSFSPPSSGIFLDPSGEYGIRCP